MITALQAVTKREGESYEAFVLRAAADPIGRRVNLATCMTSGSRNTSVLSR